jgi:hypothetical protein
LFKPFNIVSFLEVQNYQKKAISFILETVISQICQTIKINYGKAFSALTRNTPGGKCFFAQ